MEIAAALPIDLPDGVWMQLAQFLGRCFLCDERQATKKNGFPSCMYCMACWSTTLESLQQFQYGVMSFDCAMPRQKYRGECYKLEEGGHDWNSNVSQVDELNIDTVSDNSFDVCVW